ncbi:hypothetical protein AAMO2058_000920200 [Amorphochlora amoebiformis]
MLVWSTARVSRLLLQRGLGTTPRIRRLSIAPYGHIDLKKLQHQVDEYKTDNFLLQDFANALPSIPSNHVFANADTSLAHISHYGFDYDYTLATYNKNLPHLIYDLAKTHLIEKMGYPEELASLRYNPDFAIRGLHLDKETGMLVKLDQYNKIQLPIYDGTKPVTTAETVSIYGGLRVSKVYARETMHMLKDLFALPEACLYADVIDRLREMGDTYVESHVVSDVNQTIEITHASELMHKTIASDPGKYIQPDPCLVDYLLRLRHSNRSLFLLTNSPYYFVDAGMKQLVGPYLESHNIESWKHLFDVVIVQANKPSFYQRANKFRKVNPDGSLSLKPVTAFFRGEVYTGGGLEEFHRISRFNESSVIYMGDQIYSDLVEPQRATQWKTAAIIRELGPEMEKMNERGFRSELARLLFVERLISEGQTLQDCVDTLEWLKEERSNLRMSLKSYINPYFGSTFRTNTCRTAFFYNVGRYADIYTSSINNFLEFSTDYCFYASREFFPHESRMNNPETMMAACLETDKLRHSS